MTTPSDSKTAKETANPETDDAAEGQAPERDAHYLRVAMRKARRLGLNPESQEEAARMLEERGIDVLKEQITMMHVAAEAGPDEPAASPAPVAKTGETLPAEKDTPKPPQPIGEVERLREIAKIKRGMIRRRRLRLMLLFVRLFLFVALPSYLVGYYYYNLATPMYEIETQMSVQRSDPTSALAASGAMGMSLPNTEDSTVVQGYLTSREAMQRLNDEFGFMAHHQQDNIDDIRRLPTDATLEDGYAVYKRSVIIGYDPTVGVIKMTVRAFDRETALNYSRALISYAEERVDEMSQRVRDDQMRGALESNAQAEEALQRAQQRVLELQEQRGILSPDAEINATMSLINNLNLQVEERRLALAEINANSTPNSSRANVLSSEIERLEARIEELRQTLTSNTEDGLSLARISGELRIAETELQTRALLLQATLENLEAARVQADRQVRYIELAVSPVAPDVATYPRKLENTLLAVVIFFGIYIFLSLTVSILREQVNA